MPEDAELPSPYLFDILDRMKRDLIEVRQTFDTGAGAGLVEEAGLLERSVLFGRQATNRFVRAMKAKEQ